MRTDQTGGPFRKRHYGHEHDMKEENEGETGTTLSRRVHSLRRAASPSPGTCWRSGWLDNTSPANRVDCVFLKNSTSCSPLGSPPSTRGESSSRLADTGGSSPWLPRSPSPVNIFILVRKTLCIDSFSLSLTILLFA